MWNVYPHRSRGKLVGFVCDLGKNGAGKRVRKFFKSSEDAHAYGKEHDKEPAGIDALLAIKTEVQFNLDRLKEVQATLTEAVSYFLEHRPRDLTQTLDDVFSEWLEQKNRVEKKQRYLDQACSIMSAFSRAIGEGRKVISITTEEIGDYVFGRGWSPTTINNHLTQISVVLNFAKKKGYLIDNPAESVERPTPRQEKPHILTPDDFSTLLNRCLKKQWYDRLTIFVLIGFCGIRLEEACQLDWRDVDLEEELVKVPAKFAKKARFRNNPIRPNALKWLELVSDKRRTGRIVPENWKGIIRSAIRFAHIDYQQNCLRHSFVSYALAGGWKMDTVMKYLGHLGDSEIIHAHYRNVATPKQAARWWKILPPG